MNNRATHRCGLWTLPDLWKAPSDLPTAPWKTPAAFPTSAHRPYWFLFMEYLESMRRPAQY